MRTHSFHADVGPKSGGADSAPDPHDYFDASLAACKALTVTVVARSRQIPLERVAVHVDRDNSEERSGIYKLAVRLELHGEALTDAHRRILRAAAEHCPIHKLMTTTEVVITMAPD